jgi:hypothetical protein
LSYFLDDPTNQSEDVLTLLNILTPKEIAAKLKNLGYRGKRYSSLSCPLSSYLNAKTGNQHLVSRNYYRVWDGEKAHPSRALPKQVKKFIKKFDKGKYPELINE